MHESWTPIWKRSHRIWPASPGPNEGGLPHGYSYYLDDKHLPGSHVAVRIFREDGIAKLHGHTCYLCHGPVRFVGEIHKCLNKLCGICYEERKSYVFNVRR